MAFLKYLTTLFKKNPDSKEIHSCGKEISIESVPMIMPIKELAEPLFNMSQAARKSGVTRQAIYFAIKKKRLTAKRENGIWLITKTDLELYFKTKYSRSNSKRQGQFIFDKNKGFYSIVEAANFMNKTTNHIYYLVRVGKLSSHRQGSAIVIQDADLHRYIQSRVTKNSVVI